MLGPAWIALLRRIPAGQHDMLAFVLNTGIEIALQSIQRLERDFVVVRGRMTGSMDTGRLMVLPYDQINCLAFTKPISESDMKAILGSPGSLAGQVEIALPQQPVASAPAGEPLDLAAANAQLAAENGPPSAAQEPVAAAEVGPPAADVAPTAAKPAPISKTILLARLRARLADQSSRSQR